MREKTMEEFEEPGKPKPKRGRPTSDSYLWHQCYHDKALAGVSELNAEQRGVYITIIWLSYSRRGPLPDDDNWLARQCNEPLRKYRRIKGELISLRRIVVDAEAGHLYDERSIRELVKAEMFSEAQAERASHPKPAKRPRRPRVVVDNTVTPPANDDISLQIDSTLHAQNTRNFESNDDGNSNNSTTSHGENASQEKRKEDIPFKGSAQALPGVASLADGSDARPEPNSEITEPENREARLAEMKRRLREAYPEEFAGDVDEAPGREASSKIAITEPAASPPGDRTCRRTA